MNMIYRILREYSFESGMDEPDDEWVAWVMHSLLKLVGPEEFRKLSAASGDPEDIWDNPSEPTATPKYAASKMLEALMTDDFGQVELPQWFKDAEFPNRTWIWEGEVLTDKSNE